MDKAKELLRGHDKTVTEVAFEVGYTDPNYFSSAFKRVVGVNPGRYRRKVRQNP